MEKPGETPSPEAWPRGRAPRRRPARADGRRGPSAGTPAAAPAALPSGTVALLATDIVGSTALGHRIGEPDFTVVMARHHEILRGAFERGGGAAFKDTGDGFWVAFETAHDALACACACQQALAASRAALLGHDVPVRMAVHVAALQPDGGDYRGLVLHDFSRLVSAAQGGQILVSEAAEAVLRHRLPDGVSLADRGRFLLRDAPAPEHLFEAVWPDMPVRDLPAPNAPRERTPSLPAAFTRFFGREKETEQIAAALRGGASRLTTITGMGGTGKTRLAIEVARGVADHYSGAVWFVPLADLRDPARLADAVRAAVGGAENAGDAWEALAAALGPAPCLLVLDNLEHLLRGDDGSEGGIGGGSGASGAAGFVRTALERLPALTLLVTSRQRLDLDAEREVPLGPLATPAGGDPLERLRGCGSVALFEDRAGRARHDFRLSEQNAAAVAELCGRLEGIPLAVELAAAWARVLTPAEMLAQLPAIRRSRDRSLPERHRSLSAAIDGSYRLLDADLRRFFRRLSAFRGGWTADAARAVGDEPEALERLWELRDRSLLVVEERGDTSRYSFLETLREFAAERLAEDPEEEARTRARHTAHFAALAAEAETELKGPAQAAWLNRLAAEHQNLRAALAHADQTTRLEMASQLSRYWTVRGHLAEGREWLADAVTAGGDIPFPLRAKALNIAGILALSAGDFEAAAPIFATCRRMCEENGHEEGAGLATVNLAIISNKQGDFAAARREYEKSLETWRKLDRPRILASVLSNLGAVANSQGDYESARAYLDESLRTQHESRDSLLRANTLHNLAEVATYQGDYETALDYIRQCTTLRLELKDHSAITNLVYLMARIKVMTTDYAAAAVLYGAGEAASRISQSPMDPTEIQPMQRYGAEARANIGDSAFTAAWRRGSSLNWNEIIDTILKSAH